MDKKRIELSIVIPIYNSEKTIGKTISRIDSVLCDRMEYEIVLVNDGSKDDSYNVCKLFSKNNKNVVFINFSKNFGQHNALMAGYKYACGNYILSMDDDLQTAPEEIIKLYDVIVRGDHDVVYANYQQKKHSPIRNIGSNINNKMAELLINKPSNIRVNSFYIMKKFVRDEVVKYDGPYPYLLGLIFRVTQNICNVDVKHYDREYGVSNYSLKKLLGLWLNGFTNFSVIPLRLSSFLGFFMSLFGFVYISIIVFRKIFLKPDIAIGWTSMMAMLVILSGVQMVSLGLLGEYIGRIFISNNASPQYVIKDVYKNR